MADILISDLEEGIPAGTDFVIYDPGGTGFYKKAQIANLPGGGGSSGTTLTAPTLSAAGIDADTIRLTIGTVANETSIEIQRSNDGTTGWSTINTAAANTTSYDDNGLAASTTRHYRVRAVGDGVTYLTSPWSSVASATTSAGFSGTYLTWSTIGTQCEQYNSNQGIRKNAAAGVGWGVPEGDNVSVQQIATGERVVFTVPDNTDTYHVGLNTSTSPGDLPDKTFGIVVNSAGTTNVRGYESGSAVGSNQAITNGHFACIFYDGSNIRYQTSPDGTTWTTFHTSAASPSGSYYVHVQIYDPLSGTDRIYKI